MEKLTFYGGAKNVTGANYLLEELDEHGNPTTRILVDCGLEQGVHYCESDNFTSFPYDPKTIDAVIITHAHIDHTGRVPKLYREGFRGTIYSTPPTKDFAEHLLLDSINILNDEAETYHCPSLYEIDDINDTLQLWKKIPYHQKVRIGRFSFELYDAGHILGSSFVVITLPSQKKIVFSGDLGNMPVPLIRDTEVLTEADYALIESTYGGRLHENKEVRETIIRETIIKVIEKKGTLIIPAFALERTQQLLYAINELVESEQIPQLPIYLDSPLAIKLTAIYKKYSKDPLYFDDEALSKLKMGDEIFNFPGLNMTLTTEQSKEINDVPSPKVIIAGAGMMNGGRILHHAARYLQDPKSTLLLVGYQAQGTLGRELLNKATQVQIHDWDIPVRCTVRAIGAYSAHGDQPLLLAWLQPMRQSLKHVFIVQGEEDQMISLKEKIESEFSLNTTIPSKGETIPL